MKNIFLSIILFSTLLCSCVSSVTSHMYYSNRSNIGIIYSLPKTRLKANLTYTIQKETRMSNGMPISTTETVLIYKPITLETIISPDEANTFVLSGEGLAKDSRLDTSFKFEVGDNKLLTSVTSDITDKTPAVVEGLVSSGISIAKMVAVAGERLPEPLEKIHTRLNDINNEIAQLASNADPNKLEKIEALEKEQQALLTFATKYKEMNTPKTEERDVTYSVILDLKDFLWDPTTLTWKKEVKASGKKLGDKINDSDVPGTTIEIIATADQYKNSTTPYTVSDEGVNGIFYRAPTFLHTKVTFAPFNIVVFDDYVPFVQASPINKIEARYKVFANRKTTIIFSSSTGSIKEYGIEASSSAEAVAKSLDSSLSKTQAALVEIRKAQESASKTPEEAKVSDLEMKKKLVDAEANLIKAHQELNKLKTSSNSE